MVNYGHSWSIMVNNQKTNTIPIFQVIFLLLGSFILASALSKHHIAKRLSTSVLARVGTHPSVILVTIMTAALVTSMFMSNVTAPTLCYGILHVCWRGVFVVCVCVWCVCVWRVCVCICLSRGNGARCTLVWGMLCVYEWRQWHTMYTPW